MHDSLIKDLQAVFTAHGFTIDRVDIHPKRPNGNISLTPELFPYVKQQQIEFVSLDFKISRWLEGEPATYITTIHHYPGNAESHYGLRRRCDCG